MSFTGDKLVAMQTVSDVQNTSGTTGSASKTSTLTGGTACGVAFVAPPSGRVTIYHACGLDNSGANFSIAGIRVRTGAVIGSGSDVVADTDDSAVYKTGTGVDRRGASVPVTGLTEGASYNVQGRYSVGGGTGTFDRKVIIVQPQI